MEDGRQVSGNRTFRVFRCTVLSLAALCCLGPLSAFAQSSRTGESSQSSYFGDVVILQYQINLLQRMIVREQEALKLIEAFSDLGIPYRPPPPPESTCKILPFNLACYKAWPGVYGSSLPLFVKLAEELEQSAKDPPPPPELVERTPKPLVIQKPKSVTTNYLWAEIVCAGGSCEAVLTEGEHAQTRRTVRENDLLSDGSLVTKILYDGVRVLKEGKTLSLKPASASERGGPASPLLLDVGSGPGSGPALSPVFLEVPEPDRENLDEDDGLEEDGLS